jgi:hypothetical protein
MDGPAQSSREDSCAGPGPASEMRQSDVQPALNYAIGVPQTKGPPEGGRFANRVGSMRARTNAAQFNR